jgi:hypothetical protein
MANLPIGEMVEAAGAVSAFAQTFVEKRDAQHNLDFADVVFKELTDALSALIESAKIIDLPVTNRAASHALKQARSMPSANGRVILDPTDRTMLTHSLSGLISCLYGETESRVALPIAPGKLELFEQKEPLFGTTVAIQFATVAFDIAEAGKCLALELPTAAVFHLMRIMEASVGALARCLDIPDPVKPSKKHWGAISGLVSNELDRRNEPNQAIWIRSTDKVFFAEMHVLLENVRSAWRNPTMHPDKKHEPDEALNIFSAVKGFMQRISWRLDENGEPKA